MKKIVVSKFGGTSMGSLTAMVRSASLCDQRNSDVVVVSAVSGVTELLIKLHQSFQVHDVSTCEDLIKQIKLKHQDVHDVVICTDNEADAIDEIYQELSKDLSDNAVHHPSCSRDKILSYGERLSSAYFQIVLSTLCRKRQVVSIDARDLIITDSTPGTAIPQINEIKENVTKRMLIEKNKVWLTQGFIGRDSQGTTTTLGRGGSDYTAALLAEALDATSLEIWTDVSGVYDSDPVKSSTAKRYETLDYDEALRLALNGAKVIHPGTIFPTKRANIPVYVANTFKPELGGTRIGVSNSY